MDIITGNIGWIEVIAGPMFSGKSEELIRRLRRAMIARKRVQIFKPVIDDRYSRDEIVSHGDLRLKALPVKDASEILGAIDWRSEVIGVDEANFMGMGLIEVAPAARRLRQTGDHLRVGHGLHGPTLRSDP